MSSNSRSRFFQVATQKGRRRKEEETLSVTKMEPSEMSKNKNNNDDDSDSATNSTCDDDLNRPVLRHGHTASHSLVIDANDGDDDEEEDSSCDSDIEILETPSELPKNTTRMKDSPISSEEVKHQCHDEQKKMDSVTAIQDSPSRKISEDSQAVDTIPNPSQERHKENRFSMFAFAGITKDGFDGTQSSSSTTTIVRPAMAWTRSNPSALTTKKTKTTLAMTTGPSTNSGVKSTSKLTSSSSLSVFSSSREERRSVVSCTNPKPKKKKKITTTTTTASCEFVPMRSIPKDEQETIAKKWHSCALGDLASSSGVIIPLEVRRYQVLLATLLHARCQEGAVRKAMAVLREAFTDTTTTTTDAGTSTPSGMLTVQVVAKADPQVLALHITNLQYYNMKAQYIVKSAKEIVSNFHGIVPEDETSLLKITGIGKVFADLLAFVNTREIHERYSSMTVTEPSGELEMKESSNRTSSTNIDDES